MSRRQQILRVTMMGGAKTWQQQLLSLFPAGDDVAVYKAVNTGYVTYNVFRQLYQNRYWHAKIGYTVPNVGSNAQVLQAQTISDIWLGYNDQTALAVTNSGFTCIASAIAPGARLMYATSAGNYLQVAITNTTALGALVSKGKTDGGIALITIDGDNTLADLLTTAQDLVTAGTIPDTALVANGGTLNPTDRCLDTYNLAYNYSTDYPSRGETLVKFTTSLALGTHTLRITNTAYKNGSSSAAKTYAHLLIGTSTSKRAADGGFVLGESIQSIDIGNTWEISYYFAPTGTSTYRWLGHSGQAKIITPFTLTVDGGAVTLGNWEQSTGSTLSLTENNSIRHADIGGGATELGTYDVIYTMSRTTGLTIAHTVTWATDGLIECYPCMMSLTHSVYDRFKSYGQNEKDLTSNNDSVHLNSSEQAMWAWDYDGNQAAVMYIPSLADTVENWAKTSTDRRFWWSDISAGGGSFKKAYATRYRLTGEINTFSTNDVITSEANYRVAWFPGGADAALAGKY